MRRHSDDVWSRRPKRRHVTPRTSSYEAGLCGYEEKMINKALFASLQDNKKKDECKIFDASKEESKRKVRVMEQNFKDEMHAFRLRKFHYHPSEKSDDNLKTEGFLTFLCLRDTCALPVKLDYLNSVRIEDLKQCHEMQSKVKKSSLFDEFELKQQSFTSQKNVSPAKKFVEPSNKRSVESASVDVQSTTTSEAFNEVAVAKLESDSCMASLKGIRKSARSPGYQYKPFTAINMHIDESSDTATSKTSVINTRAKDLYKLHLKNENNRSDAVNNRTLSACRISADVPDSAEKRKKVISVGNMVGGFAVRKSAVIVPPGRQKGTGDSR